MAVYWVWWALAAILVGAELMTGTFYPAGGRRGLCRGRFRRVAWSITARATRYRRRVERRRDRGRASLAVAPRPAARRRSTSANPSGYSSGRMTAARASITAVRSGTPNSRHPACAPETMYIVGTTRFDAAHRRSPELVCASAFATLPFPQQRFFQCPCKQFAVVTFALFIVALIVVVKAIRVVPQQHAWVVERLGRFLRCWSRDSIS